MTTATGPSFELIRDAFVDISGQPASSGAWTTFLCPTHDDNQASAGIKHEPDEHRTVVRCFAGCPDALVLDGLGLTVGDLFDQPSSSTRAHTVTVRNRRPRRTPAETRSAPRRRRGLGKQIGWPIEVAQYVYRDIDGMRIGRVIRTRTEHERGAKKGFYLRRYEPSSGTWPLGAFEPVLYRLPEIAAAIGSGQTIWICEGEKDVDRAAVAGLVATCNALGAGSFTLDHAQQLTGARRLIVVADRDRAGYAHARTVRKLTLPLVHQVIVIQARDGKDFSDHLDAGHGLEEFDPAIELGYSEADVSSLIESAADAELVEREQPQGVDTQLRHLLATANPAPHKSGACRSAVHLRPTWQVGAPFQNAADTGQGVEP